MATAFIRVTDTISVAGQIDADDVARAAADGFAVIVNNRPEGETPDQPPGFDIAQAAAAHGLDYVAIPVTHAGFTMEMVEAMRAALAGADGPVLAFCRSGTRSINLWALSAAAGGADADALIAAGRAAGYELGGLAPTLRQLAGAA